MNRLRAAPLIASLAIAACSKTEAPVQGSPPAAIPSSAPASSAPAQASKPVPATAANDPLPAHTEAARAAAEEITKANYKSELDKIEKEIP